MRRFIIYLLPVLLPVYIFGQAAKDTVRLQDLRLPASPGFALLDLSPTTVESATSPKMLGLQVMNYINSGSGGFPKNFAFEFAPYWLLKNQGETIYKYLGLPDNQSSNMAAGVLRKLSASFTVYSNDTSTHLLPRTTYVSAGLRTNLLTIWGKYAQTEVKKLLVTRNQLRLDLLRASPDIDLDILRLKIDSAYTANSVNAFTGKPMFVLDAAFAYSEAFAQDNVDNKRFNRSGWWLNAIVNVPVTKPGKDHFFLILYYRNLKDNYLSDTVKNTFVIQPAADLGIRAGYENGPFQVSVEHVNRNYRNLDGRNLYRTTGIIQFKMNDGVYLMGSFGKNFSQQHSLFTMLGVHWGIGKQALTL
jgi:hypothetical protein